MVNTYFMIPLVQGGILYIVKFLESKNGKVVPGAGEGSGMGSY